jgi:hypothetical protein
MVAEDEVTQAGVRVKYSRAIDELEQSSR